MDPTQNPQDNTQSTAAFTTVTVSKKKVYIITGVILVILLGVLLGVFLMKGTSTQKGVIASLFPQKNDSNSQPKPKNAIAKVGDEYIYQSDLDTELATYPTKADESVKKMLLSKLVKDSIVLQAAKKEKLLSQSALTKIIYNSSEKNYMKRINAIQQVEKKIDASLDQISGTIVSIWFNNMFPPKMGLEAGKKEAYRRISELRNKVANKEITIEDAGKLVITDSTLAELDPGYQNNGLVTFSVKWGKRITIDDKLDAFILTLKPGQVSDVFLGRNVNGFTDKLEDAFYAFVQVTNRVDNGNTKDFNAWYEQQKKNYAVTYY